MCMFEKVRPEEKKVMIHAKVKLLRLTRTAEGGRTVGTMGTGYKPAQSCSVQSYTTGVMQSCVTFKDLLEKQTRLSQQLPSVSLSKAADRCVQMIRFDSTAQSATTATTECSLVSNHKCKNY